MSDEVFRASMKKAVHSALRMRTLRYGGKELRSEIKDCLLTSVREEELKEDGIDDSMVVSVCGFFSFVFFSHAPFFGV